VHNIGSGLIKKLCQTAKSLLDWESFSQLLRHQRLSIVNANDLTTLNPADLRSMRVSDLPAADYGDPKHLLS
jgi:hypothetical protein